MTLKHLAYYRNKSILITGGTGYIGFSLAKRLSQVPCRIMLLTRNNHSSDLLSKSIAHIDFVHGDITDKTIWGKLLKNIDIVFHLAGQTSSAYANSHPLEDLQINVIPIINFIETTQKLGMFPDIIFSGTSTQVGLVDHLPVDESHKDSPITVYDIHKLTAEKYVQFYSNKLGHRSLTLRLCNIYGPGPDSSKSDRGITNLMIKKALQQEALTIYGEGNFVRDYLYIDDLINAFLMAGSHIDILNGNYYTIGTGIGYTIKEMVELIAEQVKKKAGFDVSVSQIPFPAGISPIEFRNYTAEPKLFHKKTNWTAEVTLEKGIEKTIEYFLNRH